MIFPPTYVIVSHITCASITRQDASRNNVSYEGVVQFLTFTELHLACLDIGRTILHLCWATLVKWTSLSMWIVLTLQGWTNMWANTHVDIIMLGICLHGTSHLLAFSLRQRTNSPRACNVVSSSFLLCSILYWSCLSLQIYVVLPLFQIDCPTTPPPPQEFSTLKCLSHKHFGI